MNETTTTTLFEGAKDKLMFAEVIIDIIKGQHKGEIQLENIPFGIKHVVDRDRFEGGIPKLQEIGKMQGNPRWKLRGEWKVTAQQMLDLFQSMGEIEEYHDGIYRLRKEGLLYKDLAEKLEASKP